MHEIHSPQLSVLKPSVPKPRRALRLKEMERKSRRRNTSHSSEAEEESFRDQSTSYDTLITESSSESEENEKTSSLYFSQNRSRTISPERNYYSNCSRTISPEKNYCSKESKLTPTKKIESLKNKQTESSSYFFVFKIVMAIVIGFLIYLNKNKVQTQSISNPTLLLSESIENLKATFYNQELDIWNDISSAINEVISRTPKIPSIILLFAKEKTTMDCLATKLAHVSSNILHADNYLIFNPKDFGNDAGEIITTLNEYSLEKKKVVIIRDILNINAEAIKALHNLCDRINPLIAEAIYILTMQTNSYQPRQKKLNFVENQIYNKLSKSIDQDILMALVTRVTDGAIISVQPEPQLKYC